MLQKHNFVAGKFYLTVFFHLFQNAAGRFPGNAEFVGKEI